MGVVQRFKGKVAMAQQPDNTVIGGLTAHSGGTKAAALVLDGHFAFFQISTVAAAADSILLPPAIKGHMIGVTNDAATNSMQVFGRGTDTINLVATATGVAQAAGVGALYFCVVTGNWVRVQSS